MPPNLVGTRSLEPSYDWAGRSRSTVQPSPVDLFTCTGQGGGKLFGGLGSISDAPQPELRPRTSGGAGGGSPAPASPAARSGLGRSVHMPDAGSDAHEHARWQSVQWSCRDGRGCSGLRRAPECAGARLPSGSGAGGGPCPQKTCPGIGRMRRSNPRPDRRPTLVTAAVQPRCDTRARRRRPRHATPLRATHRHGTVTNLGGTSTRRHPRRWPWQIGWF